MLPILAIGALGLGLWAGLAQSPEGSRSAQALRSGTQLPNPRPLKPFDLTATDNSAFTLENLQEQWTFLAFGYTHCPDVCPTTLATFDAIDRQTRKLDEYPKFLFISVDPERDSPEKLGDYVRYFNPDFLGATGTHENLQRLSGQLGIIYAKVESENSAMGYLVDHSASILLLDPGGRLAAIFSAPHDPKGMAEDYKNITRQ